MCEKLELKDFDIIGIINLNDVQGIEKYTTPIIENGKIKGYLSRSKEYYNVKNMTELALEREELKSLLTREITKKNFVILENMLNCSAKVYFKKFEQYIKSGKDEKSLADMKQAENCLMEDTRNILVLLKGQGIINVSTRNILPVGMENSNKRAIEMDNKAIIYSFLQLMKMNKKLEDVEIVTPGYGSVYIGPFLKAMYGYDFTNLLKSKYITESAQCTQEKIDDITSSSRVLDKNKIIILLDDNVGTGDTLKEIKNVMKSNGIQNVKSGAIQFNWRNYYRVKIGEKKDIDKFNIDEIDFLSPLNYAGHKLYKHAIDLLHSSGMEYIQYLNSKSYRLSGYPDLKGVLDRGVYWARQSNVELAEGYEVPKRSLENRKVLEKYKDESGAEPFIIKNLISKRMIKGLKEKIVDICSSEEVEKKENVK